MWKVRHEGSPHHLEVSFEQIRQGLIDGAWEPTDEVMGPSDKDWVAIENHPALEELAMDIEPPPPRTYDDETRLDMNALIDVCLVLLVFFILTTTVAALQVRLEAPSADDSKVRLKTVTAKDVQEQMIHCKITIENNEPVIRVEGEAVDLPKLTAKFVEYVRRTKKTSLLLEYDDNVTHGTVVKVIDAAKGAGVDKVNALVPR